jgi:ribulose-phosphate 3-epimerase
MAENPEKIIKQLALREGDIVSFHIESNCGIESINKIIKEKKAITCLAISPKTELRQIFSHLISVDQVLLMSVQPGFSGQSFLKESIERLKALHTYKLQQGLKFEIGMDGGINEHNIHELVQNGATSFAVASAIFSKADQIAALKNLYDVALEG